MVRGLRPALDDLLNAGERPLFSRKSGGLRAAPQLPEQLLTLLLGESCRTTCGSAALERAQATSVELIIPPAEGRAAHVKLPSNGSLRELAGAQQARAVSSSFFKLGACQLSWCPCHRNKM